MKRIVKQVVGIDVAQKELVVCLGRLTEDLITELFAHKTFTNDKKGFAALVQWVKKMTDPALMVRYVMEATGVYHESLAYYLLDNNQEVSIILPNKISNYVRTLIIKTVTDKTASEAIARFGIERTLECWKRPKEIYRRLRQLTRERDQIVQERTMIKNQLHAEKSEAFPNNSSIKRFNQRLKLLNQQDREVKKEIADTIRTEDEVRELIRLLRTIPGIGELTGAIILAETNGFDLIRSRRQLASYAGYDVREKQSGTSVKGKPRISKRGNKYLRKALHLPALASIRSDERPKAIFARMISRHGVKMKAVVAISRKLLEMTFTVFKNRIPYDKEYFKKQVEIKENATV